MSTIRDVAKLANVSTATVSRVINNDTKYKITEATRQRVLDAIAALDYSLPAHPPKHRQEDIVSPTQYKVGVVLSVTKKKYNDPYFMSILSGIEKCLQKKGSVISFIKTGAELNDRANLASLFQEPVSGMILMETLNKELFDYVRSHVSYIVGIDTMSLDIDNVGYDHYQAALMATQHLISQGHTKIGFIGGIDDPHNFLTSRRYQGYYIAMTAAGLKVEEKWCLNCDWDEDICAEQVDAICTSGDLPTAFFVSSDLMAIVAINILSKHKLSIPQDVAVIGISDIDIAKYTNPPLTTVHIPTETIGEVAANVLLARMSGSQLPPQKILQPISLKIRDSVQRKTAAAAKTQPPRILFTFSRPG